MILKIKPLNHSTLKGIKGTENTEEKQPVETLQAQTHWVSGQKSLCSQVIAVLIQSALALGLKDREFTLLFKN